MIKLIDFHGTPIRFSDSGRGEALVFLHGYLLSLEVWQDFVMEFVSDYRVICIDLPGHGESGLPAEISTMEVMGAAIEAVLEHLNISKAVFFGHSMGGYAALALLDKRSDLFSALVLFHSHTLADGEEVKDKRDREIKLIGKGHRGLLVSQSIPNMFANDHIDENMEALEFCKLIAKRMDDQSVKAAILGLRARHDRSKLLAQASCPCLNIIGRKDNFISFENVSMKMILPLDSERLIAENAGHMGFFEQPELIQKGIHQFLNRIL